MGVSAIRVIVFTPKAAEKCPNPVSLQIETLQLLIIGNISLIENLSRGVK